MRAAISISSTFSRDPVTPNANSTTTISSFARRVPKTQAWSSAQDGRATPTPATPISFRRSTRHARRASNSGSTAPSLHQIAGDQAASRTIDLLALNHPSLLDARRQALKAQGLGPSARKPISAAEAGRLAAAIMTADLRGEIAPYCVAVRQVAERFARQSKAHAARVKGAAGG